MYRLQVNSLVVEASTPEEVVALVNALSGRIAPVGASVATRVPAKATLKRVHKPNGIAGRGEGKEERRQGILVALRDKPMMVGEMSGLPVLQGVTKATIYSDLYALEAKGEVARCDEGFCVTNPSPAMSTM